MEISGKLHHAKKRNREKTSFDIDPIWYYRL